jgi:predicted MFS family arabinose efflux permease
MFIFHSLAFYSDIKVECGNYHQQKNTMPSNIIAWLTVTAFVLFQFTYQMSSGTLIKAIQIDFEISAGQAGLFIICL